MLALLSTFDANRCKLVFCVSECINVVVNMKVLKRDTLREIFVTFWISLIISLLLPNPFLIWWQSSANKEVIHVGIIVKGVYRGKMKCHNLKYQFTTLYRSILQRSRKYDLHFVILTDKKSAVYLDKILRKFIKRDKVKEDIKVWYDFVDSEVITRTYQHAINEVRPIFTSNSKHAKKYTDDLFLMGPFYHRVFPYEKFVMLDADLKFRIDIAELYDHFDEFGPEQVMGVAVDLAPHYRTAFREYRKKHPGTLVGEPGRFQGFNTGVVLYHLGNMRRSSVYNKYVNPQDGYVATKDLADHYSYSSHLGDQCFFTLLGMEHPELFYPLSCAYNFQLDLSMAQKEYKDVFFSYHNCTAEPKIYHGNGGAEIPED